MSGPEVIAFVVDETTGKAASVMSFPSAAFMAAHTPPDGHRLVVFDKSLGSADDFETVLQDGHIAIVERTPDPALELAVAKLTAQAEISAAFANATMAGCETPWGRMDCDEVAQGRITRLVELIERTGSTDQPINFTRFDRSQVTLSYGELVQLGVLIGLHFLSLFETKQAKERALAEAEDLAAAAAIDPFTSWP